MKNYNIFTYFYNKFIKYTPAQSNNFFLTSETNKDIEKLPINAAKEQEPKDISNNYSDNLNFFKSKYNSLINSDVVIREFSIIANNTEFNAALIFIDGMVDTQVINSSVLKPLMLHNLPRTSKNETSAGLATANDAQLNDTQSKATPKKQQSTTSEQKEIIAEYNTNDVIIRKVKKFNLKNYIYSHLIPQNSVTMLTKFEDAFSSINMGNSILIVETLDVAFDIDAKGFKQRSISSPQNEIVVRGSQEAFVENIRTNTSMLRRIINNEDLVIENCAVGKISKTKIAVCYLSNIANNDLVAEVKFRVNNLDIDYLTSSGQLEQLIQDDGASLYPQLIATERPDKVAVHLLEGRVAIIVNDTPYVLVAPRRTI